jgi:pathogenesis-related protein 1
MLNAHNQVRCSVNPPAQQMPAMSWSASLEATAQAWANQCIDVQAPIGLIDHNANRSVGHPYYVGENIAGSTGTLSPLTAVQLWAAESANYNFSANTCTGVCGHYTQLVWAMSVWLGCARSYCGQPDLPVVDRV